MNDSKTGASEFWDRALCGDDLYLNHDDPSGFKPALLLRASSRFKETRRKQVVEIGSGLGAVQQHFGDAAVFLNGIDLTPRGNAPTAHRLSHFGLTSNLKVGDAESRDYPNNILGHRHRRIVPSVVQLIWPRGFIKRYPWTTGSSLIITAVK